jgi:hypothetical protein
MRLDERLTDRAARRASILAPEDDDEPIKDHIDSSGGENNCLGPRLAGASRPR